MTCIFCGRTDGHKFQVPLQGDSGGREFELCPWHEMHVARMVFKAWLTGEYDSLTKVHLG